MNGVCPTSAAQLPVVGRDAVGARSGRRCGFLAYLGRRVEFGVRKRWIGCCVLLCTACLSGCQRPAEPVGPTKTRSEASGRVAEPISRDRAIEIAEAETRRRLESWWCAVPDVLETTAVERREKDGWDVGCVYAPRDAHGLIGYVVLRDGRIYDIDEWFIHERNSLSEEERKRRTDEFRRMLISGFDGEDK